MDIKDYVSINQDIKTLNKYIYNSLDITQNHIMILYYVLQSERQEISLQELISTIKTTGSILTKQVKELEKRGYITKERCEDNLRKVSVSMTNQQKEDTVALLELINEYIEEYTVSN
ncbi:MarR family transcriptional regulator [Staphylococcus sp. 231237_7MaSpsaltlick]|uniref:transcriptional regulator, SarA/Rot family n=1 Tax=Staphylococcus TaxID=1279 RepID=UPI00370AE850